MGGVRIFQLVREEDVSGISGTGVIAEGVEFTDGTVAMRWAFSEGPAGYIFPTLAFHPDIRNVERLHGHGGRTKVVWAEAEE